ncbi:hypothetical protein H4R21_002236 [Coemansia helicoidea]|nr:hypothetical protein H4R21_002236 [Coemansia helicoidea]
MEELLAVGRGISQLLGSDGVSERYLAHFAALAQRERQDGGRESGWPAGVRQAARGLEQLGLGAVARIYRVASTYYSWPLAERALCMAAPSPAHLCKLVVLENKRWRPSRSPVRWANARHYCVVVQYVHSVSTAAMVDFVRALDGNSVAKKHFNFRLASPETALELTGYGRNAVSPIGMLTPLPVILCAAIAGLSPPVLWLGAGHVDYKLALPVQAFVDATQCLVADISVPAPEDSQPESLDA